MNPYISQRNYSALISIVIILCFPGSLVVKNLPANTGDTGLIPGSGRPLEKEMAIHSSILAWRIPWTEETGGYSPQGCKRVGDYLMTEQQQHAMLIILNLCIYKLYMHTIVSFQTLYTFNHIACIFTQYCFFHTWCL